MQTGANTDLRLTPEQRRLVRDTFDLLREQEGPLGLLFYGKLFELDPGARKLFHNDLALQVQKLMQMLGSIVDSLDDLEPIRERLGQLGRQHASYGVRPEQYETLSTALMWAIAQALGPDFDRDTKEAWQRALRMISIAMTAGIS